MTTGRVGGVCGRLRRIVLLHGSRELTDGQLLDQYINRQEEAAFEALVCRHGPMVLGVCRRVLRHQQDAEDAFQATFLVLVRRATAIRPRNLVGNWLHGVAYRTALALRTAAHRRRDREQVMARPAIVAPDAWAELLPLLDQELNRLPERYRAPIVLCDLEGKTQREAARHLGCPEGTVAGRLSRGRALLAQRLRRHGPLISGGLLAATLASDSVQGSGLPPRLTAAAVRLAQGTASPHVITLTEGVLKIMLLSRLRILLSTALFLTLVAASAALLSLAGPARARTPEEEGPGYVAAPSPQAAADQAGLRKEFEAMPWILAELDPAKGKISVALFRSDYVRWEEDTIFSLDMVDAMTSWTSASPYGTRMLLSDCPLAKDLRVSLDGKEAGLKDLARGMRLALRFSADGSSIARIDASSPESARMAIKALDMDKRLVTVAVRGRELTVAVAPDAKFQIAGAEKGGQLKDLKVGMRVAMRLGIVDGRLTIMGLVANP